MGDVELFSTLKNGFVPDMDRLKRDPYFGSAFSKRMPTIVTHESAWLVSEVIDSGKREASFQHVIDAAPVSSAICMTFRKPLP